MAGWLEGSMEGGMDSWEEGGSRRVGARRGRRWGFVSRKGPCNFSINKFPPWKPLCASCRRCHVGYIADGAARGINRALPGTR